LDYRLGKPVLNIQEKSKRPAKPTEKRLEVASIL
jgi:hypothetical protein